MADMITPSNNSSSHTTPTQTQAQAQAQAQTPTPTPRTMPVREDCWSEEATATLIEAWGQRYLDLNRGNLRQKQWQEVADTVNSRHGHNKKARRTDVQCKNRIDTLKKKYKIEKSRVLESNSVYVSPWLFFPSLDRLIGNSVSAVKKPPSLNPSPTPSLTPVSGSLCYSMMNNNNGNGSGSGSGSGNGGVNVNTPVLAQKRPLGAEDFRRNYAAVAAAAAREEEESEEEEEDGEEEEVERESEEGEGDGEEEEGEGEDGIKKLARVIEKFGEVYARVEREKQKQLIELEKQRMEFAKELECQRMQMLVEMQVQLEKFKRAKRSHSDNMYS